MWLGRALADEMRLLTQALDRNTAATIAATQQEQSLMADLSALTAVVAELAADDSALATAVNNVDAALQAAQAGGFTQQNAADLAAAVASLTQAHTDFQATAAEATAAVTPPAPPASS